MQVQLSAQSQQCLVYGAYLDIRVSFRQVFSDPLPHGRHCPRLWDRAMTETKPLLSRSSHFNRKRQKTTGKIYGI